MRCWWDGDVEGTGAMLPLSVCFHRGFLVPLSLSVHAFVGCLLMR